MLKFVGRYFYLDVPKNRAILVQKLCGEKNCQNPFSAILRLRGVGGKALVAWPLVDELFFCGFP